MWTFIQRVIGATALQSSTYEEVEADPKSLGQAAVVVLLSAAAAGIGARGFGGHADVPAMAAIALMAWAGWALLTYYIGVRLLPSANTRSDVYEMMRTMGFAAAPGILRVVGVIPELTTPIFALTAVWMLFAMVLAVRQALDFASTARAVLVCGMGWVLTVVVVVILGLFTGPTLAAQEAAGVGQMAFRLEVVRGTATLTGTSVLIQTDVTEGETTHYFLTSAALFRSGGHKLVKPASITIAVEGGSLLRVAPDDVWMPKSTLVDVAVIKARGVANVLVPPLLTLDAPRDTFKIAGFDRDGHRREVHQRVRHLTTLRLLGDRSVDPIVGCEGAPAITAGAIFGVVASCTPGDLPVIVPFAAISTWIRSYVPNGLRVPPPIQTNYDFLQKELPGPLVTVSCGEVQSGTVDVPFTLEAGQLAIDAHPTLMNRNAVRLGDVTVLNLNDRRVALRFTLTGQEPPRFQPPTPCPQGQALISVRLDIVSDRRR